MILEKLSNEVNPKKKNIDPPRNWKQKRSPDKIGSMGAGDRRKGRKGIEEEKGRIEENLREWNSCNGGRRDMRARKEIS